MRRFLKEFFTFSYSEMRVIVLMSGLIVLLIVIRLLIPVFQSAPGEVPEEMAREVEEFISGLERKKDPIRKVREAELFEFNPNTADREELLRLGISQQAVSNILKYREAGGIFRKPSDLKKIYNLDEEDYLRIQDYILIPPFTQKENAASEGRNNDVDYQSETGHESGQEPVADFKKKSVLEKIELNSAGKEELMSLPGIGNVYSERIIKYRELLGGFFHYSQLGEVYGLNDSMVSSWENLIFTDSSLIRHLSVNYSEYPALIRHPYLKKKDVEAILKYREFRQEIFNPEDLKEEQVLSDSLFERLSPYLVR